MTWESFQLSSEYILWKDLYRVANEYGINEDNFFKKTDLGGEYWEPFLDRVYKIGCILGYTKKLREIKMDWIRPILYFGAQSQGIIEYDGRRDNVNKGAIANAILVKFSFKSLINAIQNFGKVNEKNYSKEFSSFKKDLKYYFIQLSKFVKDGFNYMHQHIKLILKPLLDLRRSGYRLFALEQSEKQNRHLTIFNDKKDLSFFINSSKDFFKWEQYKQSKDAEGDKLKEFIRQNTLREKLLYSFSHEKRESAIKNYVNPYATNAMLGKESKKTNGKRIYNKNNELLPELFITEKKIEQKYDKRYELFFPNITSLEQPEPTKFKHDAYQKQFEEGLNSMIEYLNRRLMKDFPYPIDTHKIFVNIKYIPNGKINEATNYYINRLLDEIEILKEKCYEMKLNGISRILMPITRNVEIIAVIKKIFDLHVIIDNVMGNYLLYDQYMFIYKSIKLLKESSLSEQIMQIKNEHFMEEIIPKYVFFQSLCHSLKVLEKMKKYYKEEFGKIFKYEYSYQISGHQLEQEDNELIFAYEIYGPYKRFFIPSLQEKRKKLEKEVKQFGRFWIMEGFFSKEDKKLWLEAIESLSNINELVREDMRDSILNEKEKTIKEEIVHYNENLSNNKNKDLKNQMSSHQSSSSSLSNTKNRKTSSKMNMYEKIKINKIKVKDNRTILNKKRKLFRQRTKSTIDLSKINLNSFRPPKLWNYPLYRLIQLKNERISEVGGAITLEIRNVDPSKCYVDGRIQKFYQVFDNLYSNMKKYWDSGQKADTWEYFYEKVLRALGINYALNRLNKAQKMAKEKLEEEESKKREEEERELKKKMDLFEKQISKKQIVKTKINSLIFSDSSNNNITTNTNNIEEIRKAKKIISPIKKIKLTKDKSASVLKKIKTKDDIITNETTT